MRNSVDRLGWKPGANSASSDGTVVRNSAYVLSEALAEVGRARARGKPLDLAKCLLIAAETHQRCGDLATAYRIALEAEQIAITHDFADALARAELQIGNVLTAAGNYLQALPRLSSGLAHYRQLRNMEGELRALESLGRFHLAQGQFEHLFVYLEEALRLVQANGLPARSERFFACVAEGHVHYAIALRAQGLDFEANTRCERALRFLQMHAGDVISENPGPGDACRLDVLARLHLVQGRPEEARRYAYAMLLQSRRQRLLPVRASACQRIADIRMAQAQPSSAIRWFMRALNVWRQLRMQSEQIACLDALSAAHEAQGDLAQALRHLRQARASEQAIRSQQSSLRAELMVIELNAEKPKREHIAAMEHTNRLAALGRMVASITHEVTQPLSAIRLVAENAIAEPQGTAELSSEMSERKDGEFSKIIRLADQLSIYIQHLKRFTRRDPIKTAPIWISRIVAEAVAITEPKRRSCDCILSLQVDDVQVTADEGRTCGILVNLLSNAFDAIASAASKKVQVSVSTENMRAIVRVRDAGLGLDEETVSRLFEPFYTTKKQGEGLGLGLALSMDIATQMGARLSGANHPAGGAEFVLDLPLAESAFQAIKAETTTRQPVEQDRARSKFPRGPRPPGNLEIAIRPGMRAGAGHPPAARLDPGADASMAFM